MKFFPFICVMAGAYTFCAMAAEKAEKSENSVVQVPRFNVAFYNYSPCDVWFQRNEEEKRIEIPHRPTDEETTRNVGFGSASIPYTSWFTTLASIDKGAVYGLDLMKKEDFAVISVDPIQPGYVFLQHIKLGMCSNVIQRTEIDNWLHHINTASKFYDLPSITEDAIVKITGEEPDFEYVPVKNSSESEKEFFEFVVNHQRSRE